MRSGAYIVAGILTKTDGKTLLLLKPRGFCAGVVRAIDVVRIALEAFGPPIYVRKEIVHNSFVVEELRGKGAIFVDSEDEVPNGDGDVGCSAVALAAPASGHGWPALSGQVSAFDKWNPCRLPSWAAVSGRPGGRA